MKHKPRDTGNEKFSYRGVLFAIGFCLTIIGIFVFFHSVLTPINQAPEYIELTTKDSMPSPCTFIDVRNESSFENGSIGGSINIPYSCSSCFTQKMSVYSKSNNYVIYGPLAYYAAEKMYNIGFRSIYILTNYQNWTHSP